MSRVAIMPNPRPGNRAGLTPFTSMPWESAHSVNRSWSSPGHQFGFILRRYKRLGWRRTRSAEIYIKNDQLVLVA